jgi:hypothetical protein
VRCLRQETGKLSFNQKINLKIKNMASKKTKLARRLMSNKEKQQNRNPFDSNNWMSRSAGKRHKVYLIEMRAKIRAKNKLKTK